MKTMPTKRSSPALVGDAKPSAAAIAEKVRGLRQVEMQFLGMAKQKQRNATLIACAIGSIIHHQRREYGQARVEQIARQCGFSRQTAYDYLHLYRGALTVESIVKFPNLNREYWQALGSSIKYHQDMIGRILRRFFLTHPLWRPSDNPDEKKPDAENILQVGKVANATRTILREMKIAYAFEQVTNEGDDTQHFKCAFKDGDEEKINDGLVIIAELFKDVAQMTGWPKQLNLELTHLGDGSKAIANGVDVKATDNAKTVLFRRHRQQRIDWITKNVSPLEQKGVSQKVFLGRCEDVLQDKEKFPLRSVDVVICDPPYSGDVYAAWREHTGVDHDSESTVKQQVQLVGKVFELLVRRKIIKEQFIMFCFCPMDFVHEFLPPILDAFKRTSFIHQVLVWDKTTAPKVGGDRTFGRQAEAILYINIGNKPLAADKAYLHSSVLSCPSDKLGPGSFWKPVELIKNLIQLATYKTNSGAQVVLDMFAGAGSTGVAAIECGRDFRLIESHQGQFDLAMANVLDATRKVSAKTQLVALTRQTNQG